MAGHLLNEGALSNTELLLAKKFKYALCVSNWNMDITERLKNAAAQVLINCQVPTEHMDVIQVPGSFELILASKWAIEYKNPDAVICLGCIIKGETIHDEMIAMSVSSGIMDLQLQTGIPIIFGVLTVNNLQQALDRSGGKMGNKGEEAMITAIKMLSLKNGLTH